MLFAAILLRILEEMHSFDENGICRGCGFIHPLCEENKPRQTITLISPVTIHNGEVLTMPAPVTNENGQLVHGNFMGEITKDNVVRIIGQG